jgi:hypothetical protein
MFCKCSVNPITNPKSSTVTQPLESIKAGGSYSNHCVLRGSGNTRFLMQNWRGKSFCRVWNLTWMVWCLEARLLGNAALPLFERNRNGFWIFKYLERILLSLNFAFSVSRSQDVEPVRVREKKRNDFTTRSDRSAKSFSVHGSADGENRKRGWNLRNKSERIANDLCTQTGPATAPNCRKDCLVASFLYSSWDWI